MPFRARRRAYSAASKKQAASQAEESGRGVGDVKALAEKNAMVGSHENKHKSAVANLKLGQLFDRSQAHG